MLTAENIFHKPEKRSRRSLKEGLQISGPTGLSLGSAGDEEFEQKIVERRFEERRRELANFHGMNLTLLFHADSRGLHHFLNFL